MSTGKALFPLADLAEISFAGTLPAAVAPARLSRADFAIGHGTQLQVLGFGRTGAAIASTVTYDQSWNGDRVFGLFTAETPHQEGPCFGDSGGGVYAFASGEWQLVGLVAGTWAVFGRDEMRCEDSLALFTDLRRYQSWLSGSGSMPLENMVDGTRNSPQNSDSAFAAACRDQAVGSEAWRTTQELLLESATGQVLAAGERPIDGLLDCTLGARWATAFAAKGSEFSLHQTRDLQPLQLLPQVTALTLRSPEVEDWSPLLRQPSLRSLTVIGSSEPIRLAQLIQLPKLTTLRLEYVTLVESAAQARAMEDRLRSLSFTKHDVKTAASTLEELIQH